MLIYIIKLVINIILFNIIMTNLIAIIYGQRIIYVIIGLFDDKVTG